MDNKRKKSKKVKGQGETKQSATSLKEDPLTRTLTAGEEDQLEMEGASESFLDRLDEIELDKLGGGGGDSLELLPQAPIDTRPSDDHAIRLEQLLRNSRAKKQSFWETVCNEIDGELSEVDLILGRLGLPPYNYRKDKVFPPPPKSINGNKLNKDNCISRLYLDTFVFPHLLPAIQGMLDYVKHSSHSPGLPLTFNPLDFILQHLYANNPKYPERKLDLIPPFPLEEIPWAGEWLRKYPRPAPPKWVTMSPDEAAKVIQAAVRIWLAVRIRKRKELERKEMQLAKENSLQRRSTKGKEACRDRGSILSEPPATPPTSPPMVEDEMAMKRPSEKRPSDPKHRHSKRSGGGGSSI